MFRLCFSSWVVGSPQKSEARLKPSCKLLPLRRQPPNRAPPSGDAASDSINLVPAVVVWRNVDFLSNELDSDNDEELEIKLCYFLTIGLP
jgi:hypothetical protein